MKSALAVIAKSPVQGQVKTRLCPPLEPEQALDLYRAFLLDTLHLVGGIEGVEPGVLFTPDDAHTGFRAIAPSHFFLIPQHGDGFGVRLANGFRELFARGYDAAAIMDADSPTLPREHIRQLFKQLEDPGCDVCVGPCEDGGYWAIGMKRLHLDVLTDIRWSTELVLAQTLLRAREAHLSVTCAPAWFDVDDGAALERLRIQLCRSNGYGARDTRRVMNQLTSLASAGPVKAELSGQPPARPGGT